MSTQYFYITGEMLGLCWKIVLKFLMGLKEMSRDMCTSQIVDHAKNLTQIRSAHLSKILQIFHFKQIYVGYLWFSQYIIVSNLYY